MREFLLDYGDTKIPFAMAGENIIAVLTPQKMPSPPDETALVREAVQAPINSPVLADLVRPGETACIVVGDMTRLWARHHILLPVILEELNRGGVRDEDITIVSATGAHREQTREEHILLVGEEAVRRVRVVDHNCLAEDLVSYGETSRGTPVRINKEVARADRVILTGGIVYHFLAGYGGGKKSLMPGVSDYQGIMANHRLALNARGPGLNPAVAAGKVAGNPLAEDMLEAANMVGVDFIVNTIVNEEHKIARVVAGAMTEAHARGCALVDHHYGVPIREKADLVIASCGGYPKDINMYQSYKTVHNIIPALKRGGVGIVLTESREGIGSELFQKICSGFSCNEDREADLRSNFDIAGFMGYTQLRWAQEHRLLAVTDLPGDQILELNMIPAKTLEEALHMAQAWLPKDFRAYIMPEGSTTFPMPS
jgi:lactate racemase